MEDTGIYSQLKQHSRLPTPEEKKKKKKNSSSARNSERCNLAQRTDKTTPYQMAS